MIHLEWTDDIDDDLPDPDYWVG